MTRKAVAQQCFPKFRIILEHCWCVSLSLLGVLGKKPQNKHIFVSSPQPCSLSMRKEDLMLACCITFFSPLLKEVLSSHRKE